MRTGTEYYRKNREAILEKRRIYEKKLRSKNKKYKIKRSLCNLILRALTNNGNAKSPTAEKLLGCTINEFIFYLECKFKEGMTWENRSLQGWHLDHIIPCSSFDLTKKREQKKCFHYTNYQPLWAEENLSKGKILL